MARSVSPPRGPLAAGDVGATVRETRSTRPGPEREAHSAINQRDGYIEITQTRNAKPRRIDVGNDPKAGRLLETLRSRLRAPRVASTISPPIPEPTAPQEHTPITISTSDDERYCYLRSSKLMEYYSDPIVIDALMEQLEVPGTLATHKMMDQQGKTAAITATASRWATTTTIKNASVFRWRFLSFSR